MTEWLAGGMIEARYFATACVVALVACAICATLEILRKREYLRATMAEIKCREESRRADAKEFHLRRCESELASYAEAVRLLSGCRIDHVGIDTGRDTEVLVTAYQLTAYLRVTDMVQKSAKSTHEHHELVRMVADSLIAELREKVYKRVAERWRAA